MPCEAFSKTSHNPLYPLFTLFLPLYLFDLDPSSSKCPPNTHLNLFLLIDLLEDECHYVEVNHRADEAKDLDDRFEEETDAL